MESRLLWSVVMILVRSRGLRTIQPERVCSEAGGATFQDGAVGLVQKIRVVG